MNAGVSEPRGERMTYFASLAMLGGKQKFAGNTGIRTIQQILMTRTCTVICVAHKGLIDAATRCVLRPVDASK